MDHLPMTAPLLAIAAGFTATCAVCAWIDTLAAHRRARYVRGWLASVRLRRAIRQQIGACPTCGATTIAGTCIDGCGRR